MEIKKLAKPDEVRPFAQRGRAEIYDFESGAVGRTFMEPGWRWSQDVKPIVGTDSCQVAHKLYVLKGRLHIRMNDGAELEIGPGDLVEVTPGHDAWVIGDETVEMLDFAGMKNYAKPQEEAAAPVH